jgi:hypothetical protein
MAKGLEIPFDRVTWRDGQLLTANDLQSDQTRNSRLWQLHTRHLHDTWGIATGFQVYADSGDSALQVGPGYAIDPDLAHLCAGADALQETPVFQWKSIDQVQLGLDVPLITVQVMKGQIQSSDTRVRRYVQKLTRPYIASGQTDQGNTQWKPNFNIPGGFVLYTTVVDTSSSGFNNVPYYFPQLHMWNEAPAYIYGTTNGSTDTDFADYGGPDTYLTSPTATGFTFNLLRSVEEQRQYGTTPSQAQWTVSWVGVEVAQCAPPFHLLIAYISNFERKFPIFRQEVKF